MVSRKKPLNESSLSDLVAELISRLAYRGFENRNFESKEGDQMNDWLEAEEVSLKLRSAIKDALIDTSVQGLSANAQVKVEETLINFLSNYCNASKEEQESVVAESAEGFRRLLNNRVIYANHTLVPAK